MTQTLVTRNGQITLAKRVRERLHIREGDRVNVNVLGEIVLISKRDPRAFETHDFLPEQFSKTLHALRAFSHAGRLRRLGVL